MKVLRWLFFPIGILYYLFTSIRNLLFTYGVLSSHTIQGKSIGVGNLNLGGSGKSPLTLYLMKLLQKDHSIYILSRGYGRETKGFIKLSNTNNALEVGDEPLMYYHHKKENDEIVVCENRTEGLSQMHWPQNGILLLDDVFQHRSVTPGLNLIVSDFNRPFFKDYIFPIGRLRERRKSIRRADAIIFTKCPSKINEIDKNNVALKMSRFQKPYFFCSIHYPELISINNVDLNDQKEAILVTGISNPKPLNEHLSKRMKIHPLSFKDHHKFKESDLIKIHKLFDTFDSSKTIIITTEKDFMRLKNSSLKKSMLNYPWFVQPMEIVFHEPENFNKFILDYVE